MGHDFLVFSLTFWQRWLQHTAHTNFRFRFKWTAREIRCVVWCCFCQRMALDVQRCVSYVKPRRHVTKLHHLSGLAWECLVYCRARPVMYAVTQRLSPLQTSISKKPQNKQLYASQSLPTTLTVILCLAALFSGSFRSRLVGKLTFPVEEFSLQDFDHKLKTAATKGRGAFDFTGCCKIDTHHKLLLLQPHLNSFNWSWQILHIL